MDAIYAASVAAAKQAGLLGTERINRMIESGSVADAVRILSECGFGGGNASDVDAAIEYELRALLDLIRSTAPDPKLRRYLLAEYDYHNAEALIKGKYLPLDPDAFLLPAGDFDPGDMKDKILKDEYSGFPAPMRAALERADELFATGAASGLTVGALFTRALYEERSEVAAGREFLRDALSYRADCENILICLRAKNYPLAAEMFLPGGTLGEDELKKLCAAGAGRLEGLALTRYAEFASAAAEADARKAPYLDAERIADGYALSLLKEERFGLEGYLPFLLYVLYKKSELTNVRIVVVGLSGGIPKQEIRARLRESYEG